MAIAAPVGPTTALVIHRTIKQSWNSGVLSGLGAALADSLYALLAGLGAGLVAAYIEPHQMFIRAVGGIFLLYWGWRIFVSRFAENHPLVRERGWGGPLVSTFLLTLTNPMTLLAFAAVLVGLRSGSLYHHSGDWGEWMVGVGAGSISWWLALSSAVHPYRQKFDLKVLAWVNRIIGMSVIIAGAAVITDFVKRYFG